MKALPGAAEGQKSPISYAEFPFFSLSSHLFLCFYLPSLHPPSLRYSIWQAGFLFRYSPLELQLSLLIFFGLQPFSHFPSFRNEFQILVPLSLLRLSSLLWIYFALFMYFHCNRVSTEMKEKHIRSICHLESDYSSTIFLDALKIQILKKIKIKIRILKIGFLLQENIL